MSLSRYGPIVPSNPHQNINPPGLHLLSETATSSSTPYVIWSIVVPRGQAVSVRGLGTAIKSDHSDAIGISYFTTAVSTDSNEASVINSIYETITTGTVNLTFTISTSGSVNTLECKVTVAPAGAYTWNNSFSLQLSA